MGVRFIAVVIIALSVSAITNPSIAATHEAVPSAEAISAEIDMKGAEEVVQELWNSGRDIDKGQSNWDIVTDQIWRGRVAYIKLAPKLSEGADAGPAEDLGISLAHALPLAPNAVLRVIDPKDGLVIGVSRVCGVPFLEGTAIDWPEYIRQAKSAVGKVTMPELQGVKAACLEKLGSESRSYPKGMHNKTGK